MDWILDNIDWLFPIGIVLLFWFQRTFMSDEEREGKPPSGESEEAKRVREEIRRKIVARQQGESVQEAPPVEEVFAPVNPYPVQEWPSSPFSPQPTPVLVDPPVRQAMIPEPQHDLLQALRQEQERLRRAQRERAKALRKSKEQDRKKAEVMKSEVRPSGTVRDQILVDLSTGGNLKRAFVLKEIVDRPVGIRPSTGSDWS